MPLSNGEALPTLRQYLQAGLQSNKGTRLVLEIKPSTTSKEHGQKIAEKVVALVRQSGAAPMVDYISFDYEILKKIRSLDPKVSLQYLNGDRKPEALQVDGITGADYHLSVYKKNPDWIESAQKKNLLLNAWTVNTGEDMMWLIERKFNYITTDEPELLLSIWSQLNAPK